MVFVLETAKDSFDIILQVGAGTGLLYLVRWFWWRVNAWCEIVAMVSSFVVSIGLLILRKMGTVIPNHYALMITVGLTTLCWVATAYLGPQTNRKTLLDFYRKVRPFGPGWKSVRAESGIAATDARGTHESVPLALVGWSTGCAVIWSALFLVGNILYKRWDYAAILGAIFVVSGIILIIVVNRLWTAKSPAVEAAGDGGAK
jgi:hypothetical protein